MPYIEIRITDIEEVAAVVRDLRGLAADLRELVRPSPPYWTRAMFAARLGVNLKTLQNDPTQWPPFHPDEGPTSRHVIRREDGERWVRMTREERRVEYRTLVGGKLRLAK